MDVPPERLERFLDGFAARHGPVTWTADPATVVVTAADGAVAECHPLLALDVDATAAYGGLVAHVSAARTVGVLLVRRGGYAAGVFEGSTLIASKVGSRHVQGRSAAGGWSQQRFARRREGQAREAVQAAADTAVTVLLHTRLDALVAGGDRAACDQVLADPRLAPLRSLLAERRLDVPDPRRRVLEEAPGQFRAVRVRLLDEAAE